MQGQMIQMLMTQLKARNPQAFQVIEKARQSNGNPMELFKQITNKYTPEQMTKLMNTARQYGVPDDVIKKVQNNDINDLKS